MKKFYKLIGLFMAATMFMWSCSLDKDIDSINNRLDNLEGERMATIEQQLESMKGELSKVEEAEKNINVAIESLKTQLNEKLQEQGEQIAEQKDQITSLQNKIQGLESALEELQAAKEDYLTKAEAGDLYATIESHRILEEKVGAIEGRLAVVESTLAGYESILDTDEFSLSEIIAKIESAQNQIDAIDLESVIGDINELKEALALCYSKGEVDGKISALESDIDSNKDEIASLKSELNAIFKSEAYTKAFQSSFDSAIKSALENDGIISKEIAEQIASATSALDTDLSNLEAKVDKIANIVYALAERIQSIVFVPEFKGGDAVSMKYKINGKTVGNQYVSASFQITPAKVALDITEENVIIRSVATKAAGTPSDINVSSLNVRKDGTGIIDVTFPINKDLNSFAFALYIADSNELPAEGEEKVEAGSFVSSGYVDVAITEIELTEVIGLYDAKGTAYPTTGDIEVLAPWNEHPSTYSIFEGYEFKYNLENKKLSISETAALTGVSAAELTPSVEMPALTYSSSHNSYFKVSGNNLEYTIEMAKTMEECKAVANTAYVKADFNGKIKLGGKAVLSDIKTTTYRIAYTQVNISLADVTFPWTLEEAVKLSPSRSNPYSADLVKNEVAVNMNDVKFDLNKILGVTPERTVKLNGNVEDMSGKYPEIEFVAGEVAHIAKLTMKGSNGYEFGQSENVYEIQYTYTLDDEKTDVNVISKVTLGAMLADKTLDLGTMTLPIQTKDIRKEFYALADLEYAKDKLFMDEYMQNVKQTAATTVINGKNQTANRGTKMTVVDESANKSYVTIKTANDIKDLNTKFEFTNTLKTWWGTTLTFNLNVDLENVTYRLVYNEHLVDPAGNINIGAEVASETYKPDETNIDKYFSIDGKIPSGDAVKLFLVAPADADYSSVNNINVNAANGAIAATAYDWTGSDMRERSFTAELRLGTIVINSLPVKFMIKDPISIAASEQSCTVEQNKAYTAYVWKTLEINGLNKNNVNENLVVNSATKISDICPNFTSVHGGSVTFGDAKYYSLDENGIKEKIAQPSIFTYNKATGKIDVAADNAEWQYSIIVEVPVNVEYSFDNNEGHSGVITVRFDQKTK